MNIDDLTYGELKQIAAMFGGVAGHAGLFGTAYDLAVLMQMLLNGGRMGDTQAVGQAAAKSQAAFADGLRQSLSVWQASVSEAFGASGDTASFAQLCQQWAQPWTAPSAAPQSKTKK